MAVIHTIIIVNQKNENNVFVLFFLPNCNEQCKENSYQIGVGANQSSGRLRQYLVLQLLSCVPIVIAFINTLKPLILGFTKVKGLTKAIFQLVAKQVLLLSIYRIYNEI